MSPARNQDWVLAQFRGEASKDDPAEYTVRELAGSVCVWLSVSGNVGWHRVVVRDGALVSLRSLALPLSRPDDPSVEAQLRERTFDYALKWVNPKRRAKVVEAVRAFSAA